MTLPTNSLVTPSGPGFNITGGTTNGTNLFHSFSEFSIPTGSTAAFGNPNTISNIITRVTGTSVSNILGEIQANGTANLFLLNPNGIVFGPNATLSIGGSFVGSTAESIEFADGSTFSAVNPQTPPLLAINVPTGLQYGTNPGPIEVQGPGHFLFLNDPAIFETVSFLRPPGLQVAPGQTLALVGGGVTLDGGNLTTNDGRVELGSVGGPGTVSLAPNPLGLTLGYDGLSLGPLQLINEASVEVSGNGLGQVQVQGSQVTVTGASAILANTLGVGTGGEILVRASESLEVSGAREFDPTTPLGPIPVTPPFITQLSTDAGAGAIGNGGSIQIEAGALGLLGGGQLSADTFGAGTGGSISVNTTEIFANGGAVNENGASGIFADVRPGGSGQGGLINIETGRLTLLGGAQFTTGTFDSGNAGSLTVNAQTVEAVFGSPFGPSGLFASVQPGATGQGGTLTLETGRLILVDGAQVGVSTFGAGNSGTLEVQATEVELIGTAFGSIPSSLQVNVQAGATGSGGSLTLMTETLNLIDGAQIQASALGSGDAGTVEITATTIEAIGTSPVVPSGIFSTVEADVIGNGGSLSITADRLRLAAGGQITTLTLGVGDAGSSVVAANQIELIGGSSNIQATVEPGAIGNGGSISVMADRLQLTDGAQIISSTLGMGDAGPVTVQAGQLALSGSGEPLLGGGSADLVQSAILTSVEPGAVGNGGSLRVEANSIRITDGAQIATTTGGQGNAGDLTAIAPTIELIGTGPVGNSGLLTNATNDSPGASGDLLVQADQVRISEGATLTVSNFSSNPTLDVPPGQGPAGNLTVAARTLTLDGSTVTADTVTGTDANISLNVTEQITLRNASEITTDAQGDGTGGSIDINTGTLQVESGSEIGANANAGGAGNIDIVATAPATVLLDQGQITATGGEGNITIETPTLQLQNGSLISGNGIETSVGGNITADTTFVLASDNSDITANAEQGPGGQVVINAAGIFGTQFRQELTPQSDITATSELGPAFSGTVETNVETDPTHGLQAIPTMVPDVSNQVRAACPDEPGNTFAVTGRGGVPDDARQPLRSGNTWQDHRLILPESQSEGSLNQAPVQPTVATHPAPPETIVEADGWIQDDTGHMRLVAQAHSRQTPASSVTSELEPPNSCQAKAE